jgi:hypothetical protein
MREDQFARKIIPALPDVGAAFGAAFGVSGFWVKPFLANRLYSVEPP